MFLCCSRLNPHEWNATKAKISIHSPSCHLETEVAGVSILETLLSNLLFTTSLKSQTAAFRTDLWMQTDSVRRRGFRRVERDRERGWGGHGTGAGALSTPNGDLESRVPFGKTDPRSLSVNVVRHITMTYWKLIMLLLLRCMKFNAMSAMLCGRGAKESKIADGRLQECGLIHFLLFVFWWRDWYLLAKYEVC